MKTFICYKKCSTCKKAQKFLEENNVSFVIRDIKEEKLSKEELTSLYKKSGLPLKKFFNTSGKLYRELELSKRSATMSEDEILTLLASDGMLVKRPILISDSTVLVGFKEEEYTNIL